MSKESHPLLSVRAEARRSVAPDSALVLASARATGATKAAAVNELAAVQSRLTGQLTALSGVVLTAESLRAPLTWSMHGISTNREHDWDDTKGQHGPTGRLQADLSLQLAVRDFTLLDKLSIVLAGFEPLTLHSVSWHVDADNAAWAQLRAEAISAAITKARHYAAALGGTLLTVEHIADVGLLSGDNVSSGSFATMSGGHVRAAGRPSDAPSLDPAPLELVAIIEARYIAGGVELAE